MLLFTLASAGYLMTVTDVAVLWIALVGVLLAFFYTANPICLKKRRLGDLVIFLCFGPVLMAMVSVVVVGEVTPLVLAYSVPMGLLTVAILHANNTRDIEADTAVGIHTVAAWLGAAHCYKYYCFLLAASYAAVAMLSFTQGQGECLVRACTTARNKLTPRLRHRKRHPLCCGHRAVGALPRALLRRQAPAGAAAANGAAQSAVRRSSRRYPGAICFSCQAAARVLVLPGWSQ
jgi:hypothetical protein